MKAAILRTASTVWQAWDHHRTASLARALASAALFALFLSAAGTVDAGFTLTASYGLLGLSVAIGFPTVVRGWWLLPSTCRAAGCVLVGVYVLGVAFGSDLQLSSASARSSFRDFVYLLDLILGLSVIGLLTGLASRPGEPRRTAMWICAGGFVAATYAVYQWPAQQLGWSFADVNNALNSDGYTLGARFQGEGILGWERVRGTFKEPLFLASYLAVIIALSAGLAAREERTITRRVLIATAALSLVALGLTASSLTWGVLTLVVVALAVFAAVSFGRVRVAGILGTVLVAALLVAPVLFSDPAALSRVTGRSGTALQATSDNRTNTWRKVSRISAQRPALGHGPGQSAVRLAYRPDDGPQSRAPIVFGSAQGLWAAALIDSGLVGLFAWLFLLASLFAFAVRRVASRPEPLALAALVAAGSAVVLGNLAADRFDLRVWVALGLVAALACQRGRPETCGADDQTAKAS